MIVARRSTFNDTWVAQCAARNSDERESIQKTIPLMAGDPSIIGDAGTPIHCVVTTALTGAPLQLNTRSRQAALRLRSDWLRIAVPYDYMDIPQGLQGTLMAPYRIADFWSPNGCEPTTFWPLWSLIVRSSCCQRWCSHSDAVAGLGEATPSTCDSECCPSHRAPISRK